MNQYKLRAECIADIHGLQKVLKENHVNISDEIIESDPSNPLDSPTYTITTDETIDTLKNHISEIQDGHVMLQTIAPFHEYSGEREY